ncbi:hypothetical protein ABZZ17_25515 [Streptomyces sp. NPDC006512]|uniref:hypothetical protein n=1 Tax=Streptomyces sp. NPDC006512 TaxID=3154307 RepID=UPI0033B5A846
MAVLMRWTLLHLDAREQYVDWEDHARIYLAKVSGRGTQTEVSQRLVAILGQRTLGEELNGSRGRPSLSEQRP